MPKLIWDFGIFYRKSQIPNPKSQIVAKIPNRCRNPKSLPKSQIIAEIVIGQIPLYHASLHKFPKKEIMSPNKFGGMVTLCYTKPQKGNLSVDHLVIMKIT